MTPRTVEASLTLHREWSDRWDRPQALKVSIRVRGTVSRDNSDSDYEVTGLEVLQADPPLSETGGELTPGEVEAAEIELMDAAEMAEGRPHRHLLRAMVGVVSGAATEESRLWWAAHALVWEASDVVGWPAVVGAWGELSAGPFRTWVAEVVQVARHGKAEVAA